MVSEIGRSGGQKYESESGGLLYCRVGGNGTVEIMRKIWNMYVNKRKEYED